MEDQHHQIPTTTTDFSFSSSAGATAAPATAATTVSATAILSRFLVVIFIAAISSWANYEASKGFEIAVINEVVDTPAGRRFHHLFVADDKATRMILKASNFAEHLLYPDDHHPKKPINRVALRLTGQNLTHVMVLSPSPQDFIIHVKTSILSEANVDEAMMAAVQRSMARVWLWDGHGRSPERLLDGMVEYVSMSAGFTPVPGSGNYTVPESDGMCWADRDPVAVALFLRYCEGFRPGFFGRLNRALQHGWHGRIVDEALGSSPQRLCSSFRTSLGIQIGMEFKLEPRLHQVM